VADDLDRAPGSVPHWVPTGPGADLAPEIIEGQADVRFGRWETVTVIDLLPELACNNVAAMLAARRPPLSITDTWRHGWAHLDDAQRVGCIDLMCAIVAGRDHPSLQVIGFDGGGAFLVDGPEDLELAFQVGVDGQRIWLSLAA
jgi:hypothetical protein